MSKLRASSWFWRLLFHATIIHFIIFGLIAFAAMEWDDEASMWAHFHADVLGFFYATVLWLSLNAHLVWLLLAAADPLALYLIWTILQGRSRRMLTAVYLSLIIGIAATHAAAAAYAAHIRTFSTPQATYELSGFVVTSFALNDLLLALPACLILAGLVLFGWPRTLPGLCPHCGYDLRATPDRCPECGAPAKAST